MTLGPELFGLARVYCRVILLDHEWVNPPDNVLKCYKRTPFANFFGLYSKIGAHSHFIYVFSVSPFDQYFDYP
jgi:hypothetical protein